MLLDMNRLGVAKESRSNVERGFRKGPLRGKICHFEVMFSLNVHMSERRKSWLQNAHLLYSQRLLVQAPFKLDRISFFHCIRSLCTECAN